VVRVDPEVPVGAAKKLSIAARHVKLRIGTRRTKPSVDQRGVPIRALSASMRTAESRCSGLGARAEEGRGTHTLIVWYRSR
jgi:hypothetical protein